MRLWIFISGVVKNVFDFLYFFSIILQLFINSNKIILKAPSVTADLCLIFNQQIVSGGNVTTLLKLSLNIKRRKKMFKNKNIL